MFYSFKLKPATIPQFRKPEFTSNKSLGSTDYTSQISFNPPFSFLSPLSQFKLWSIFVYNEVAAF
jgi:hypothetical protein